MNEIVGKRLKEARQSVGVSQKRLGIGIDEFSASARMNQYETGKHVPDYLKLSKIVKALNLPTAYFYTSDDDFCRLSKRKKGELLAIIQSLSK